MKNTTIITTALGVATFILSSCGFKSNSAKSDDFTKIDTVEVPEQGTFARYTAWRQNMKLYAMDIGKEMAENDKANQDIDQTIDKAALNRIVNVDGNEVANSILRNDNITLRVNELTQKMTQYNENASAEDKITANYLEEAANSMRKAIDNAQGIKPVDNGLKLVTASGKHQHHHKKKSVIGHS